MLHSVSALCFPAQKMRGGQSCASPPPLCRYGLVYPGLGWVIWRSKEYLPESIVFHVNYLGSDQASVTLNFSRGAGMIIAQYYQVCHPSVHMITGQNAKRKVCTVKGRIENVRT